MEFFLCFGCFKLIIGLIFLIAGISCISTKSDSCGLSDNVSAGFIGAGIGIILGSLISWGVHLMHDRTHRNSEIKQMFVIKFVSSLFFIVFGAILSSFADEKDESITGNFFIGNGCGLFVSALLSTAMCASWYINGLPH